MSSTNSTCLSVRRWTPATLIVMGAVLITHTTSMSGASRRFARTVSIEEAVRGPLTSNGPAPGTWSVVRPKLAGAAPGFTMKDAVGETWVVSFDARGYPEAAPGAILVANKIFGPLGYWQVEHHLVTIHPDRLAIDPKASVVPVSKVRRPMRRGDLDEVFRRAHCTRPDDPNDIVPHEHQRELLVSVGFYLSPWRRARDVEHPAIGRFEGQTFDPTVWRPRVATAAFLRARRDDCFWAAPALSGAVTHGEQAHAPRSRPSTAGSYVTLQVSAVEASYPSWATPVDVYVRRTADGWMLVGLERLP